MEAGDDPDDFGLPTPGNGSGDRQRPTASFRRQLELDMENDRTREEVAMKVLQNPDIMKIIRREDYIMSSGGAVPKGYTSRPMGVDTPTGIHGRPRIIGPTGTSTPRTTVSGTDTAVSSGPLLGATGGLGTGPSGGGVGGLFGALGNRPPCPTYSSVMTPVQRPPDVYSINSVASSGSGAGSTVTSSSAVGSISSPTVIATGTTTTVTTASATLSVMTSASNSLAYSSGPTLSSADPSVAHADAVRDLARTILAYTAMPGGRKLPNYTPKYTKARGWILKRL